MRTLHKRWFEIAVKIVSSKAAVSVCPIFKGEDGFQFFLACLGQRFPLVQTSSRRTKHGYVAGHLIGLHLEQAVYRPLEPRQQQHGHQRAGQRTAHKPPVAQAHHDQCRGHEEHRQDAVVSEAAHQKQAGHRLNHKARPAQPVRALDKLGHQQRAPYQRIGEGKVLKQADVAQYLIGQKAEHRHAQRHRAQPGAEAAGGQRGPRHDQREEESLHRHQISRMVEEQQKEPMQQRMHHGMPVVERPQPQRLIELKNGVQRKAARPEAGHRDRLTGQRYDPEPCESPSQDAAGRFGARRHTHAGALDQSQQGQQHRHKPGDAQQQHPNATGAELHAFTGEEEPIPEGGKRRIQRRRQKSGQRAPAQPAAHRQALARPQRRGGEGCQKNPRGRFRPNIRRGPEQRRRDQRVAEARRGGSPL